MKGLKTTLRAIALTIVFFSLDAWAVTVNEVARELECPCDCPLVLEDCNMSCGLDWKEEIGEKIKAGKTKDEIIRDFIERYGDACRITPVKRVKGKFYQYTRGFDWKDWTMLWGAVAVWVAVVFVLIYAVVRRMARKKGGNKGVGG